MKRFSPRDLALYLLLLLLTLFAVNTLQQMNRANDPSYSQIRTLFEQEKVKNFSVKDNVLTMTVRGEGDDTSTVTYELSNFYVFYNDLHELIDQQRSEGIIEDYDYPMGVQGSWWYQYLPYLLVILVMAGLAYMLFLRQSAASGGGGGPGPNRFGHARTRTLADQGKKVTFNDVAGADEEKEELQEIVEFLRDPQRFTALGARIPKGVLLVGPPGTGKTLIAKAVAGEAGVHFLSISGSDFVELYVGVGASRVRDLFDQAKKEAPAIVFIDEIDAVGRQRGAGLGGGHDEREQTLNQLLVEMDGFASNEGVIVMAATNRQDILDPALLRPGRFDRQIYVGLPDIKGREEILKVHARKKPLAEDVSLSDIAKATAGFTGADLENLLNEAALLAARGGQRFISMADLHEAMMKVIAGPEKKSRVVTPHAKCLTAYHEAGHAVVIHELETQDPVHQITIIPRGGAGLIRACVDNATVPVIETGTGICHVYVDGQADQAMALDILENAKCSRPSVCNACEVCLVDETIAGEFLPKLQKRLTQDRAERGLHPVELRLDEAAQAIISGTPAGEKDFDTEFLDYILGVKVVKGVGEAIAHIAAHSTGHSEAIVTADEKAARAFLNQVDSAAVYWNASTRFTDGGEFGLGCEMGISTQKLHARGPMGLQELCTYKYIIRGTGQTR